MNPPSNPWPWLNDDALRFDRFMELCLHDEKRGYYARRISGIGGRGDFTTVPMLSPALAQGVAHWASSALKETGCRDLIELGPGEGKLAAAVLAKLPWLRRRRTRLHLVERSVPLREKQHALLGRRAMWHDTIEDALAVCEGRACIYSNEFVDAFPVRRFRWNGTRWQEGFVRPDPATREDWRDVEILPDSSLCSLPAKAGRVIEVHTAYQQWLESCLPQWRAGRMLTIDYGAEDKDLPASPLGTLRAYLLQHRLTGADVYQNPGRQDLTTDVNFTDLIRWSETRATTLRLQTMRDFLLDSGIRESASAAQLLDPQGAGGAFLVLEQSAVK